MWHHGCFTAWGFEGSARDTFGWPVPMSDTYSRWCYTSDGCSNDGTQAGSPGVGTVWSSSGCPGSQKWLDCFDAGHLSQVAFPARDTYWSLFQFYLICVCTVFTFLRNSDFKYILHYSHPMCWKMWQIGIRLWGNYQYFLCAKHWKSWRIIVLLH